MPEDFDPYAQQDSERVLTQRIRGLRLGEQVRLTNGTVVKSVGVKTGPGLRRKFRVVPKGGAATREPGFQNTVATAEAAALTALNKRRK